MSAHGNVRTFFLYTSGNEKSVLILFPFDVLIFYFNNTVPRGPGSHIETQYNLMG